ncbi:LOW QUALITY PROTEIN: nuclear exosome regulator NRDE2-like [Rhagoletis pomonella]|uniref:LOW QUALITY PROTEIN: nuclear exosome regulator NRDE2-like n=1 Tax=Rhagoletis pomonella TaxID=28610 RepID=UPI00178022FA|nr:LOW QUALITY PROTEIN: nuclear exosome regulator NRDE2-like [Rhagoletis pomonella]XP_036341523.1 LOW QUALITY PROTEIN: nuclear exosome regulator NRDE2-like [Rhagoletis pomonella]
MSLFPAYINVVQDLRSDEGPEDTPTTSSTWLANSSFPLENDDIKNLENVEIIESSTSSSENEVELSQSSHQKKKKHKRSKKRRKLEHDCEIKLIAPVLEFSGNEEYYIDKSKTKQFLSIRTLHKPACPRYRHSFGHILGARFWHHSNANKKSSKRYFLAKVKASSDQNYSSVLPLDENEYNARMGQLNRKTLEASCDVQVWLDLLSLQDQNPYKWSRLLLAERKLDIINRALARFPCNEQLYEQYIDIINVTYPSFEVTKMLDRLLQKDLYSYTLWTAQIMTTQGSMARCIVPDVLRIYERCMSKMHHAKQMSTQSLALENRDSDNVMLRLFNNCALFLRQAGLYEQFIALLKLALELNVSTDHFKAFAPLETDQNTLIEFEELVLQSGLPMNEIWLRVEKLRQGFNFLPFPDKIKCNDPQRIVFNEDICHYIYPLNSRDNAFYLILLILRLLKVPFIQCEGMAERFSAHLEQIGESDAIEDTLTVCIQRNFAISQELQREFQKGIYTLAKEMAVSPTFLSSTIGHDIYIRCISSFLLECAATYSNIDKRKRDLFIVLWCRFERLLLILERCGSKMNSEYIKEGRKRFKNLLKQSPNRNVLLLYTEFAIYEFESLDQSKNMDSVTHIFENLIASHSADETQASDLCYTYVTFAEMLIGNGRQSNALQILISYALGSKSQNDESIGSGKKLAALQKITEKLEQYIAIEKNVEVMVLEQYLLPDYTVSLLKVRVLIQCLIGQKLDAIKYMNKLLNIFRGINDRHRFLREQILELYVAALQITCPNCVVPNALVRDKVFAALAEFPRNLFLLQHCGMLSSQPWFRIRTAFLRAKPTILSVTFLIVLARYRFLKMNTDELFANDGIYVIEWDKRCNELIIRNRILHVFKTLSNDNLTQSKTRTTLLRNALFWRLYIRFLSDQCTDFETSKRCLLTALDECPWSKALYLDGATYVPQELTHLQDLIIEKQLRIYALPEELEILRGT